MPYIGNVTTDFNVSTANINNGAVTGEKLSQPFNYDSGTLYLDDTNNRVGIGTISPSYTLDVQGSTITSRVKGSGGTYALGLYENDSTYFYTGIDTSTGAAFGAGNYARVVWSYGAYPLVFATNNTERLRITSAGNVGIGTTSVNAKLEISGNSGGRGLRLSEPSGEELDISAGASANDPARIATSGGSGIAFAVNGTSGENARIDSSGRLLVGTSSVRTIAGLTPRYFQEGSSTYESLGLCTNDNSFAARGSYLLFARSRGTTAGSNTIVQSGDFLGGIAFAGADGSTLQSTAATIGCEVDGTPGANDMPGRIVFSTAADGASSPTERMRIDSSGRLGIGTASPLKELQINATTPTIRLEESSASAKRLELSVSSSGEASIFATQSATQLLFGTVGTERARIDSSGRLLVGTSTAETWFGSLVQIQSSGSEASFTAIRNQNSTSGSYIFLGKSRGTTANSATIVQSGDELGGINFLGADGSTNRAIAASIYAFVDGTPGTNDMPGRLVFSTTADGTNSPTERFRISNDGSMSAVIPGGSTLYPASFCRAWVNFNGTGTVAIRASYNVSSITDNGTGDYTVNFTTALADANYSVFGTCNVNITGNNSRVLSAPNAQAPTTSSVRVGTTFSTTGAYEDQLYVYVSIFR